MKRKWLKQFVAVALALPVITVSVGCADKSKGGNRNNGNSDFSTGPIMYSESGTVDLGGMEIIVRDWWSSEDFSESINEYQEAREEYLEYIQETYNFTIKREALSTWDSTAVDFMEYTADGNYYVWVVHDDSTVAQAMKNGMAYDLSKLDCLDFTDNKFQRNKLHERYTLDGKIYGMYTGYSEPRTGVYFNKDILENAGIDPESIYDMQKEGLWTWDEFDKIMEKVHRDTDGDGEADIFGMTTNEGAMVKAAVYSNGGEIIGYDEEGKYVYRLQDPDTMEALRWVVSVFDKYDNHDPDGVEWDYYKTEFTSGTVAFLVEDMYAGTPGNFLMEAEFDIGFVMFPKGPQASTYVNCWDDNISMIPSCYDDDTAWKIAFAYNLYTDEPAGYEDYIDLSNARAGVFDERAIHETITMMRMPEHGVITCTGTMLGLDYGENFLWYIGPGADLDYIVTEVSKVYKDVVERANK